MAFTNNAVALPEISIHELPLTPVSPKYRIINIALNILFTVLAILALGIVDAAVFAQRPLWLLENNIFLYVAILFLSFLSITYHYFADPIVQYAIREQDIHFQAGLFFRKLVSQPILRVQHIELKRGPIERKAGLATLQVFSAGGVSHTFEIPGLDYEKAISLRKFIINHKDLSLDE